MNKKSVPLYIGLIMSASVFSLYGCGAVKPAMLQVQSGGSGQGGQQQGNYLLFTGKLSGIEEVQIYPKISGRVTTVSKDIGNAVNPGDVLVQLETTDLQAQLNSAQSDLAMAQAKYQDVTNGTRPEDIQAAQAAYEQALNHYEDVKNGTRPEQLDSLKAALATAQANYENAKQELDRNQALFDQGVIAKQAFDNIQVSYQQANAAYVAAQNNLKLAEEGPTQDTLNSLKAAVDQAKALYDKARNGATPQQIEEAKAALQKAQANVNLNQYNYDNGTLKSPIKGYVAARNIDPGEMANPSSSLMTIVDTDQVYLSIDVPENELKYIKQNADADVQVAALGKTVKGKISIISPQAEPNSDKYLVKILINNPDHSLRAGMTGVVKIKDK
ncbi:efflux RND transporter periplasmic adaptor subunit [Fodinisporobacter ferrooxydans]|uniref:Efflux RND transporter periplasmic adaptor subunit n=1 Tax=Fodinisporobacter ferrooxydans TaxID=2901836 RepID=A0ABY4CM28_9BACL|nr:efflux RND transporter periplasmic adaptor subunit [Alicyclobacillaceae bacterium MYW30-H2]